MAPLPAPVAGVLGGLARRLWGGAARPVRPGPTRAGSGVDLAARLDEVLRGRGDAFRQQSSTTCGSSSLAMARVLTDTTFAEVLLAGRPREVSARWAVLERSIQDSTNRALRAVAGAALRLPWPKALGTPPWGLRDALDDLGRASGLRYRWVRVDGRRPERVDAALDLVAAAVSSGVPAPLYVGNGLTPRHVVLAVRADATAVDLYDPGSGRRVRVERAALREGRARVSGWDLLWAVVVPR